MALAFLRFRGKNSANYLFQADIGTAKYFKYVLGERKRRLKVGENEYIEVLDGEKRESELMQINEAMSKINQGAFPLKIPKNELTSHTKYVQLYSFNRKDSNVPSISDILRLYPVVGSVREKGGLQWSLSQHINDKYVTAMQETIVKNKVFNYREPQLSKVMFWNAIINALPTIVEHAAPVLGSLLGGGNSADTNSAEGSNNAQTNHVINKVVEVLQAVANTNENSATPKEAQLAPETATTETRATGRATQEGRNSAGATIPTNGTPETLSLHRLSSAYSLQPETLISLKPILEKILSPEAILAIGDEPQKLFLAIKDAVQKTEGTYPAKDLTETGKMQSVNGSPTNDPYSRAKVAPALLAAIPALMPVIEKVLNPKTIEAIGNQPVKLFKAIGDAVLKMDEQEIKHLEAINPGVDSADDISKLLQGMSISSAYTEDLIKFKLIKNLNLEFIHTRTVNFKNKERILLAKSQRISFPYKIVSNSGTLSQKTLKKSIIQICIKEAESMKMVFRKNIRLMDVNIGQEVNEAFLVPEEVSKIPCNTELKLEVSHIWKSNKNENIGVFRSHYIHLIDSYVFDRIGETMGEPVPLNDINLHRKYWHKIWEGGFSRSNRWHVEFDLKYFYLLNPKEKNISRLETRKMITDDNVEEGRDHPTRRKVHAKLKSGTELGLEALNGILSLLNQDTLSEPQIEILGKSSIDKEFQQVARQRVEMKGREGDTATLWSYPEISLYKLLLSKVGNIDEYGQVTHLELVEKVIPKPEFIHFIGTKSER